MAIKYGDRHVDDTAQQRDGEEDAIMNNDSPHSQPEDESNCDLDPIEPPTYTYRIAWFVDVEAESPQDAAAVARGMQRDPEGIATIFTVQSPDGTVV